MDAPIYQGIKQYLSKNRTSFHMPGHKGNGDWKPTDFYALDVTELPDTDDLHAPTSYIKDSEEQLKRIYNTRQSFYLLGGATCGIFAMLAATVREGETVILDRSCHKSVIHALIVIGARPVYLYPKYNHQFGFPGGIDPNELETLLETHRDAKAVVVTSPTYYGGLSDIAALSAAAHRHGIPLLVDEAHGAHLPFSPLLPESAISCGADIVIQSVHKTLGALSGGALLHICSDKISPEAVRKLLAMFQTSSPSYAILASLEHAVFSAPALEKRYKTLLAQIEEGRTLVNNTAKAYWVGPELQNTCQIHALDLTRIVINVAKSGFSGYEMAALLRDKYKIEPEMADEHNIVCISTAYNDPADIKKLTKAMLTIVKKIQPVTNQHQPTTEQPPAVIRITPREAFYRNGECIHLEQAPGRIAKNLICKYPPGTPILVPGEEIQLEHIREIAAILESGAAINGVDRQYQIEVVQEAQL